MIFKSVCRFLRLTISILYFYLYLLHYFLLLLLYVFSYYFIILLLWIIIRLTISDNFEVFIMLSPSVLQPHISNISFDNFTLSSQNGKPESRETI